MSSERTPKPPAGWLPVSREIVYALLGLLAATVVISALVAVGALPDSSGQPAISLLYGPLLTAGAALVYRTAARRGAGALGPLEPAKGKLGVAGTSGITAVHIGLALVGSWGLGEILELTGFPVEEQAGIMAITEAARRGEIDGRVVALAVSAVVLAPLAEEWLFRGLLFRRLHHLAGPLLAYGISGLAFAVIHWNPAGLIVYLWLGLVFASSYRRTGHLWSAVVVHMGNNTFALTMLFFGFGP